jgi:hypothetical protein
MSTLSSPNAGHVILMNQANIWEFCIRKEGDAFIELLSDIECGDSPCDIFDITSGECKDSRFTNFVNAFYEKFGMKPGFDYIDDDQSENLDNCEPGFNMIFFDNHKYTQTISPEWKKLSGYIEPKDASWVSW